MASAILITIWTAATIFITLSGLIHIITPNTPQIFRDTLLYGKARGKRKQKTFVQKYLEVPKSWFTWFYLLGIFVNGAAAYFTAAAYLRGHPPPQLYMNVLDYITTSHETNTGAVSAIILICLMFIQNFRRFLECILISVYSKSTMNICHFALGVLLYATFNLAVLSEAPSLTTYRVKDIRTELFQVHHIVGMLLFAWASYQHHEVHEDLANLRKDKSGSVTSTQHRIPQGRWFTYVSCPHYFFEILIYLSFLIIGSWQHTTLWIVVIFVVDNQIVAGYISHSWYHSNFPNYPKRRAAVIPYLI